MTHLPDLISDLTLILGAAAIITIFFKKLKQPVVLGYIIAGLLVGPNFSLFPSVSDQDSIKIWAEIGVVILLFSLGLEFSFKKLVKVGGAAAITGFTEVGLMLLLGFGLGFLMGWPLMDSVFLGGIIAISSTTIIFRAFEELGLKSKQFTGLVMGILVIEDLVAVLLLVVLSTLAVSQRVEGVELIYSIFKLGFFLCLWFLLGIFLLPTFFKKVSGFLNKETLLILAIGLCLGMVLLANDGLEEKKEAEIRRYIDNLKMIDDVQYATLSVTLTQPDLPVVQTVPDIDGMMKESYATRLRIAMSGGLDLIIGLVLGLLSIWPLLLIAVVVTYLVRRNRKRRMAAFQGGGNGSV